MLTATAATPVRDRLQLGECPCCSADEWQREPDGAGYTCPVCDYLMEEGPSDGPAPMSPDAIAAWTRDTAGIPWRKSRPKGRRDHDDDRGTPAQPLWSLPQ